MLLWPLVPCILVSALIHSTDAEVGGIAGVFSSPSLLASVVIWALPLAGCAYLAFAAYVAGGPIAFMTVVGLLSGALGFILARAGSTAASPVDFAWSVFGSSFLFALALGLAGLPSGVIARKQLVHECSGRAPA